MAEWKLNVERTRPHRSRVQRKSLIATALEYEADHGVFPDAAEIEVYRESREGSRGSQDSASFQASLFSAFNKDEVEVENDGFDVNRPLNNLSDRSIPVDMTKQCSMIHRMMEDGKTDVDPRDVHKLLPSAMLSSESLDLHSESVQGKITQAINGMSDLNKLMDAQAMQFEAEQKNRISSSTSSSSYDKKIMSGGGRMPARKGFLQKVPKPGMHLKTMAMSNGSCEDKKITADMCRVSCSTQAMRPGAGGCQRLAPPDAQTHMHGIVGGSQQDPGSPVTGWPAAPVLGIMHPMNSVIGRVGGSEVRQYATGCNAVATTGVQQQQYGLQTQMQPIPAMATAPQGIVYSDISSAEPQHFTPVYNSANQGGGMLATMPLHWAYSQQGTCQIPQPSAQMISAHANLCDGIMNSSNHHMQVQQHIAGTTAVDPLAIHQSEIIKIKSVSTVSREDLGGYKSQDGDSECSENSKSTKDSKAKKFKSLEAALAWCHVQHSQKQVPVVPKDDVRKLVDFQLRSAKPIRAPWYRPQKDESEEESDQNSVVQQELVKRSAAVVHQVVTIPNKPQTKVGTGFFCPPGSALARI